MAHYVATVAAANEWRNKATRVPLFFLKARRASPVQSSLSIMRRSRSRDLNCEKQVHAMRERGTRLFYSQLSGVLGKVGWHFCQGVLPAIDDAISAFTRMRALRLGAAFRSRSFDQARTLELVLLQTMDLEIVSGTKWLSKKQHG